MGPRCEDSQVCERMSCWESSENPSSFLHGGGLFLSAPQTWHDQIWDHSELCRLKASRIILGYWEL